MKEKKIIKDLKERNDKLKGQFMLEQSKSIHLNQVIENKLEPKIKKLEKEKKHLIEYLKNQQGVLQSYVCVYENRLRNTSEDSFYYNSYLKAIHKYNAQRELIKEILSKIEKSDK